MKIIVSKKGKKKNYDRKKMKSYWDKVYPEKYVDLLVGSRKLSLPTKVAGVRVDPEVCVGKLKQHSDGFVYLDVPNEILNSFYKLIKVEGVDKPPYLTGGYNNIGAHISVMYGDELDEGEEVKEIGEEFEYVLKDFRTVNPEGWDEMERVWFIAVDAPELEKFRENYGLSKKLNGHEFHITVAVKKSK